MASGLRVYSLLVALIFPGFMPHAEMERGKIEAGSFADVGKMRYVEVNCTWPKSEGFAGMTLYDVNKEKDAYVSVNSKYECKSKTVLGKCELSNSPPTAFVKAVISDLQGDEIRTFACKATWFTPAQVQDEVMTNVSLSQTGDSLCTAAKSSDAKHRSEDSQQPGSSPSEGKHLEEEMKPLNSKNEKEEEQKETLRTPINSSSSERNRLKEERIPIHSADRKIEQWRAGAQPILTPYDIAEGLRAKHIPEGNEKQHKPWTPLHPVQPRAPSLLLHRKP